LAACIAALLIDLWKKDLLVKALIVVDVIITDGGKPITRLFS
jgi:hypothetical protein